MKNRFKKGDKAVLANPDEYSVKEGLYKGFEGTVANNPHGRVLFLEEQLDGEAIQAYDEELEFADIYNSPLWKALR